MHRAIHQNRLHIAIICGVCAVLFCGLLQSTDVQAARKKPRNYTVQSGDILAEIAGRFGCTVWELLEANPSVKNPNRIRVGQSLRVPRCDPKARKKRAKKRQKLQKRQRGQTGKICNWRGTQVDSRRLAKRMKAKGFSPPAKFRALIARFDLTPYPKGFRRWSRKRQRKWRNARERVERQTLYDYAGRSDRAGGWNPASTIKIYPAMAVLEKLQRHGLTPAAKATFHYANGDETFRVSDLISKAVAPSNNIAHNRLVQLAGYDGLNGARGFFKKYGLANTYIVKAYDQTGWRAKGQSASFIATPAITLKERGKRVHWRARTGKKVPCYGSVCTSIGDLARFHCRLMLHEQLRPRKRRFDVPTTTLHSGIRKNLRGVVLNPSRREKRSRHRGREVVLGLQKSLKGERYMFYTKPGFARDWFSDVVYVYDSRSRTRWIVGMAGFPGRSSLYEASRIVGELIVEGAL